MKKQAFFFSLIFLLVIQQGFSQDYLFKVVASKGKNKVADKLLKVGAVLQKNQQITVTEGGYLGLAHHDGRTIEISKSGKYLVDSLVKQVEVVVKGTGSKYLEYVLSEATETQPHRVLTNRYSYMNKPAGVNRHGEAILFHLPNSAKVLGNEAFVSWYISDTQPQVNKKFKLIIHDEFGEFLDESIVEGTSVFLNLYSENLKEHRMLTYKVIALDDPSFVSDEQLFFKMTQKGAEKYSDYEILSEATTALDKIILAKFFEEKGLVVDAMTTYQQAMRLAPKVEAYHKLYDDFLERAKLIKENLRD